LQAIIRVAISQSPASYSEVLQPALKSWRVLSSGFFFGINMENKGYVLVWRKMLDSGLMQMPNTLTLFMYILVNATHKDIKSGMVELKRGQYISGRKKLAKELKQSEQNIRTSLKKLEELKILTIKTTNEYSVYTIEKYDYYQNPETKSTKGLTNDQPTGNQRVTTKQTQYTQNTHIPIPDWIDTDKFCDFYNHRISIKKPMTDQAITNAFSKLKKLKDEGYNIYEIMEESIINGWSGLFEPKRKPIEQKTSYIPKGNLI
jgi:biotin operon repressor